MLDGLPRNRYLLQTPRGPLISRGTIQVEKFVLPPSARPDISLSNTFSSPFGALTCTLRLPDAVEDVRGTFEHTLSILYGTQKGVKSCQRERPLKLVLRWRILSRSCFGLCEMIRG
ncbi:hypothetical protein TNIN_136311 [Trichonephila inaurata madagascariensis]|uniref:Uncharacterized protein n=1 Tax=Trichonephila inaurata madagascariensis TaxID=2747483 RepID=A0A8X6I3I8_9ARAC|nr:hypothetical protein TNIN_136311 [Trichonephila inaurata madagascariensis]